MTINVSNSDNDWPPITIIAIERRSSAPGPLPKASGSMPATSVTVVINIGRKRSRLACKMACRRGKPSRRRLFVWSICKIEFFFTTPNNTRMPSAE